MLVSIITATFNSSEYIKDTYNTIKNQSYSNWEWLVTDDCSSDNTLDILHDIAANDDRVKIFKNAINSGAAVSRNLSISHAKGAYIAFIDSDDLWLPEKLVEQIRFMSDNNHSFTFTAYSIVDTSAQLTGQSVDAAQVGGFDYNDMLMKRATLGCSTVMLKKNDFADISMPLLRTGQDYALWLKLLKTGKKAYVLNTPMTYYRITPNSISRNKVKKAMRQWEIYRDIEKLGLIKAMICFTSYAYRAVFRK
ncbi:glycosyltransferase family 2 protein [Photobacterium sp. DNB22_13_2]